MVTRHCDYEELSNKTDQIKASRETKKNLGVV